MFYQNTFKSYILL